MPPKYNTVTLPAKVVQTRLPPLGPPATPQLSQIAVSTPITTVKVPKVQQVVVPNKTRISIPVPVPVAVKSVGSSVVPVAQSVVAPVGVGSVRLPLTTTSVVPGLYSAGSVRTPVLRTL